MATDVKISEIMGQVYLCPFGIRSAGGVSKSSVRKSDVRNRTWGLQCWIQFVLGRNSAALVRIFVENLLVLE